MNPDEIVKWHIENVIHEIRSEIFREEEFLWQESRSLAEEDAKTDKEYLLGMKNILNLVENYDLKQWSKYNERRNQSNNTQIL